MLNELGFRKLHQIAGPHLLHQFMMRKCGLASFRSQFTSLCLIGYQQPLIDNSVGIIL